MQELEKLEYILFSVDNQEPITQNRQYFLIDVLYSCNATFVNRFRF